MRSFCGVGAKKHQDCRVKGYAPNFVTIAKAVRAAYPKLPLILGCEEQDQMKDMVRRATTHAAKALAADRGLILPPSPEKAVAAEGG